METSKLIALQRRVTRSPRGAECPVTQPMLRGSRQIVGPSFGGAITIGTNRGHVTACYGVHFNECETAIERNLLRSNRLIRYLPPIRKWQYMDINLDIHLRDRELYRYRYISISIYPHSRVDIDISYPNKQVWTLQRKSC